MTTQNAITWPERYLPGTTDNFVSNEVVATDVAVTDVWRLLVDTSAWTSYYDNVSDIRFAADDGPELGPDVRFSFSTFGFPPLDAHVVEFEAPEGDRPGRLSWTATQDGAPDEQLDVLHAWLVETLPGGRTRILTQESQRGVPAAQLAQQRPNPMLTGHQDWLDGLLGAARPATADHGVPDAGPDR